MYFNPIPKAPAKKAKAIKELREKVANISPLVVNAEETVANKDKAVVNEPEVVANKHGVYADKARRRAYQREYMRKRRASG